MLKIPIIIEEKIVSVNPTLYFQSCFLKILSVIINLKPIKYNNCAKRKTPVFIKKVGKNLAKCEMYWQFATKALASKQRYVLPHLKEKIEKYYLLS